MAHAKPEPSLDPAEVAPLRAEQLPEPLPGDPFPIVAAWYEEAMAARRVPNPNAMTLATVDPEGRPSARIVLCKELLAKEGAVVF